MWTDFQAGDLTVTGDAAASLKSGSDGDATYVVTITPGVNKEGNVTLQVPASVVTDLAGNNNTASTVTSPVHIDTIVPTVTISEPPPGEQNGAFDVTITFSEDVTGFQASDLGNLVYATASLKSGIDGDDTYVVTITPNPNAEGDVTIGVPANVVTDAALNNNTASQVHTVRIDTIVPTVVISGVPTGDQNGPFNVMVTFSEDVTGFGTSDIMVTGEATATTFSGSGADYGVTITPNADKESDVTLQVKVDAAQDLAGNNNTASAVTSPVHIDTIVLTVVISGVPLGEQKSAFDVTVTFPENVTGFDTSDIIVTGEATATAFSGTGADYGVTITPNANKESDVTLQVRANAAQDLAGNNNIASAVTSQVHIDTIVPTVSLSNVPTTPRNNAFDVTVTFREDVTGFQASDLGNLVYATASLKSGSNGDDTYVVTITPDVNEEGNVTLQVPASVVTDDALNNNTASQVHTVRMDTIVPTVSLSNVPTTSQNSAFDVTVTFREDVTGFQASDLGTLVYATASLKSGSNSDATYVVTITPNPNAEGDVTIKVPANVVTDTALNNNTASQVHTVRIDTVVPTVAISGLPTGEQNGPFNVTVTFSENVTGFGTSDIMVTGEATATAFLGSGADYTVTITPNANKESDVTLQVKANAVMDVVLNNNTASAVTSPVHIDTIVPTVTISGLPTGEQKSAFDVTITFSEDVKDFQAGDLTVTGDAAREFEIRD